jgi:hypothetical protein
LRMDLSKHLILLKATSVEKGLLPAQNQGRQNGRGHVLEFLCL